MSEASRQEPSGKIKVFSKAVIVLSFVSLFNDIASEMLYPVMPLYLSSIGFTVLYIGILEGFAEAVAGLSKGYFGKLSDAKGRRLPFVTAGYMFSAVSKPLLALFTYPVWVLFVRTIDRLGKGIRTAPRDALLSENSAPENRGKVFGLHRGMDTLGAVAGPLLALLYLHFYPEDYRTVFLIAFIPAAGAVLLTLFAGEKTRPAGEGSIGIRNYFSFIGYWKEAGSKYKLLVAGLLAFALINSSDVFLLLMVRNLGYSDADVIKAYIFFNIVCALTALPAGALADKIGFRKSLLAGILVFGIAYGTLSAAASKFMIYAAFFLYGIFPSLTDGVSKAWISSIAEEDKLATALGFYSGFSSVFSLAASSLAGLIWVTWGASSLFVFASAGSFLVFLYLLLVPGIKSQPSR